MTRNPFDGVRVFSATVAAQRERLGDVVRDWMTANRDIEVVDIVVNQSSDNRFHCLSICLFYMLRAERA